MTSFPGLLREFLRGQTAAQGDSGKILPRCVRGARRQGFRSRPQPPDESAGKHEADGDQLSAGHRTAEDGTAAGVAAEKFQEESGDSVNEHERAENLAVKFSALEQPHQKDEVCELDRALKKLRGL
jgi:hypothetical protein